MRGHALFVAVTSLLIAACGESRSPTAPSGQNIATAPAATAPLAPMFGIAASSADLGACLGRSRSASCFSAARFRPLVSAAATAPGAPDGLAAAVSGSTVALAWSAPTSGDPATSYSIEAGSSPGLSNLANLATNSPATAYTATSVPAGTYYVRLRAINGSGASLASNEVVVVVGGGTPGCTAAPLAPSGLTATAGGTTVTFSWMASTGSPTTYLIEAGSSPGSSNLASLDVAGNATTYTAGNVGNGTFYVRLRSKNGCGTSGVSNEVTVVMNVVTPPGPGPGPAPPPPGTSSHDGTWDGRTTQNQTLVFTVSGNSILSIAYGFTGCGTITGSTSFPNGVAIQRDNTFNTGGVVISGGHTLRISGALTSSSYGSGSLAVTFAPPCSGTSNAIWTASK